MDTNNIIIVLSAIVLIIIYKRYENKEVEKFTSGAEKTAANEIKKIYGKDNITAQNLFVDSVNLIPKGTIIMWHGSTSSIPHGWVLCNGQNGTPNTIGLYPKGGRSTGSKGSATLTVSGMTNATGTHSHSVSKSTNNILTTAAGLGKKKSSSKTSASLRSTGHHNHSISITKLNKIDSHFTNVIFIMKT